MKGVFGRSLRDAYWIVRFGCLCEKCLELLLHDSVQHAVLGATTCVARAARARTPHVMVGVASNVVSDHRAHAQDRCVTRAKRAATSGIGSERRETSKCIGLSRHSLERDLRQIHCRLSD
jgi:hypothetical protein